MLTRYRSANLTPRTGALVLGAVVALSSMTATVSAAGQLPVDLGAAATFAVLAGSTATNTGLNGQSCGRRTLTDFDGDQKSDLAVYSPSAGYWYIKQSTTNYTTYVAYQWGLSTDMAVSGDFDGDGRADVALYRPSTGVWYILESSSDYTTYVAYQWGLDTDIAVPGDFDGDGQTDLAVYRPSDGYWYIELSRSNYTTSRSYQWGLNSDIPLTGDYDGDCMSDLALYRPSTGDWYVKQSNTNYTTYVTYQWGLPTDIAVPGDYDGDGRTDLGLYRPSTGDWYILLSSTNDATYMTYQWGLDTDIPVPGDYDGDGRTDFVVYRPSTGYWYVLPSGTNYMTSAEYQWGSSTDLPVASIQSRLALTRVAPLWATTGGLIVSGQSNATNITPYLNDLLPPPGVGTIAEGATSIDLWSSTGALWLELGPLLTARQPTAFLWWQGESDGQLGGNGYATKLPDLMNRVRTAAGDAGLPILIVRVIDEPVQAVIRAAEAAWVAGDAHATLVNLDDLPRDIPHGYHLSPAGYVTMAARIQALLP